MARSGEGPKASLQADTQRREGEALREGTSLSPASLLLLAVGCVVGWGAFTMPGTTLIPMAGPLGASLALGLGMLLMSLIALVISYLASRCEADGGIYGYVRAELGDNHAFVCGWCQVLVYVALVPLNASSLALVGRLLPSDPFGFGPAWHVAGYEVMLGEVLLSIAALVVVAALVVRGVRVERWPQTALVVALLAGVAVVCGAAVTSGEATPSDWSPAFAPGSAPLIEVLRVVAVLPWAFVGFESVALANHGMSSRCSSCPRLRWAPLWAWSPTCAW